MVDWLLDMLSYSFLARAAAVGALVSLCAALLGVGLVLKRYSMIGDGLSHVGFGALAVAAFLNASPMAVAMPVVVIAAFLLLRVSRHSGLNADAAIAIVSTASLAIGVTVVSLTTGSNADVSSYLFGSILAMSEEDVRLGIILCALVLIIFIVFYNRIFAVTFDEEFSRAAGMRVQLYNMVVALLTAVTVVLGMRLMGALLISSLVIFPALTAMRVCRRFLSVVLMAAAVSLLCFIAGLLLSYAYSTPSGASVVLVNIAAYLLFTLLGRLKGMRAH